MATRLLRNNLKIKIYQNPPNALLTTSAGRKSEGRAKVFTSNPLINQANDGDQAQSNLNTEASVGQLITSVRFPKSLLN
jgi:hypothetical protein